MSLPTKKIQKVVFELARSDQMAQCFMQLKCDKVACFEMLDKMLKKIIDTEDDKFRTVKQHNKRIKDVVTRRKVGCTLMGLVGFVEGLSEGEKTWVNHGSSSYLKAVRLDLSCALRASDCD